MVADSHRIQTLLRLAERCCCVATITPRLRVEAAATPMEVMC
jgi:hypothetical protein